MYSETRRNVGAIVGIIVLIVIICLVIGMVEVVPAGHKGVIVNSPSGPDNEEIPEGWNFKMKFIFASIEEHEWRTQKMAFVGADTAEGDVGSIILSSKDNIKVYIDFNIIYHVDETKVSELIIENGADYRDRIINPIARSIPRNVGANYNAIDIRGSMRDEVEFAISENMSRALGEKYIIVETFTLQDVRLPAAYENAIEQKKVAEQNVLTQQYNLMAEEFVANKTIVRMEATAAAVVINASAQRNSTIIRAEGLGQAIDIVMTYLNSTGDNATREYLQWVYLQALTDPNTSIRYVILPADGGVPILLDVND